MQRLLVADELLQKFGQEIEYDLLAELHGTVELADFVSGDRPWTQLFRLLDGLPPLSHYKKALMDDDDAAEAYLVWKEEQEKAGIPLPAARTALVDWTPEREQTFALVNQFIITQHMYQSAHSKKSLRPPDLLKGPETAIERVTRERELRVVESIRDRMLGRRG